MAHISELLIGPRLLHAAARFRFRVVAAVLAAMLPGLSGVALAQAGASTVLPNTLSTAAGSNNGSAGNTGFIAGSPCSPGSPYSAADVYGDGCPATMAVFGPDMMDGVHVDGQGNIFITDYDNNWTGASVGMFRRVDAKSGLITVVMGNGLNNGGTICATATTTTAGAQDGNGDGCALGYGKVQKDRGYGMDPYGNFFTGSYSSGYVRILCNAVSPLCPVAAGVTQTYSSAQKQVGFSYRIAGCVATGPAAGAVSAPTGSTTPGNGGDGYLASPFWNLPGDVAAWGASNGSFNGPSSITATNGTCGTTNPVTTGELNGSRGVAADQYGNVFIHDGTDLRIRVVVGPPSYNGVTNPLPAILQLNPVYSAVTPAQMYGRIYPVVGGYAATTKNGACPAGTVGGIAGSALDTYGDACPWFNTSLSNANPVSMTIDTTTEGGSAAAHLVMADGNNSNIRVLYMGSTVAAGSVTAASYPMANAILLNNVPSTALTQVTHGYVYLLAGNGGTGLSNTTSAPVPGSTASIGIGGNRIQAGPNGNLYISAGSNASADVLMYDLNAGTIRELLASAGGLTYATVTAPGIGTYTNNTYCPTFGQGDGTAAFSTTGAYSAAAISGHICFLAQGTGSSTQGIAVDSNNNLYLTDDEMDSNGYGRSRIRKVLASQLYPTTMGTSTIQTLRIHGPAGTTASATAIAAAALNASPSEFSIATPVCATTADSGGTVDCLANVTFAPAHPGLRTSTLALTDSSTSTASTVPMEGVSTGSALVADPTALGVPATSNLIATASTPAPVGAAIDANGDLFTMDTFAGKFTEIIGGSAVTQLAGTLPSGPTQIALDPAGDLWAAGAGASTLTELTLGPTGTYTSASVSIAGVAAPEAVAFDQKGNLFIADQTTTSVYEVAAATVLGNSLPSTGGTLQSNLGLTTIATGLTAPTSLAIDGNGNLYIGDPGANAIFRVDGKTGARTTFASAIHPAAVTADTAGDVYYQDSTAKTIVEYPFTSIAAGLAGSNPITVFNSLNTPSGLTIDGSGNLYSADKTAGKLNLIARSALTYNFGTATGTTFAATLTNVGNLASTGYVEVDATEFPISSGTSNGCGTIPSTSNALLPGAACTLTATFVPSSGTTTVTGTTSLLAAASTSGALVLIGTENGGQNPTTVASISGAANTGVYASSGTELSYTVSVVANPASTVNGYVNVTIDSGTAVKYNLTAGNPGVVTVPVSGLTVGNHSFSAIYPSGQGNDLQSNTATQSFTITQASTTTSWSPTTTSIPYSTPIGAANLNATAAHNGTAAPGVLVYTSNGAEVNAASYLPIGTYALGVTFYPTDSVNYASSTASGGNLTVTKASTTAAVGATQNLVAADGTGNFTSLQAALNTLSPTAGGGVYIKPGVYTGFTTVVTPNVSIYGLGGNPSNVVLTNQAGALSAPFLPGQGPGNNGNQGDAGSATFLVERASISGVNGGATYTPYNFYAENFTIQNTYDTDNVDTTTYANVNGVCAANQPPETYFYLFNNGTECGSQALAIWITGDQAVLNNIYTASLQDTIYAGSISGGSGYAARQYWFRGKVTGTVDYIFGDAAAVFDHTTIYTAFHSTATGTNTIEAQNQGDQTGATPSYLSGYIMNSDVFTSQAPGMTDLFFGRPYGKYSTWIMLNSYIDQVASPGYIEFSGNTNLPTSTYAEYNDHTYTDPATGTLDMNGVIYVGSGGNTGQGVTTARETISTNPGTPEAAIGGDQISYPSLANTSLSQTEAQQYYPIAFLSTPVASNPYNNGVTVWNPTTAIATGANAFVPAGSSATIAADTSVTILMRPQVPGQGAVANGIYTIPTGSYTLTDNFNGTSSTLASGTLDASGSAYYVTSALASGTHTLTWTYSGDSNFSGSTTASAYTLTVTGTSSSAFLAESLSPATYGQTETITATVTPPAGGATPSGNVTLTVDSSTTQTAALTNGVATFTVSGLQPGNHTFASNSFGASSLSLVVDQAPLTITGTCSSRIFDQLNTCSAASVTGYEYTDSQATVFAGTPLIGTTALRTSPVGTYNAAPVTSSFGLTTLGSTDYGLNPVTTTFTVIGNAPQIIVFPPLPNLPHGGSYRLAAQATSGLPIVYTVTNGNGIASVSGSTLTITGTGPVTIQATTATDATGDYAAAPAVQRSFIAP